MDASAFRQLYDYHFALNRMLWDYVMQLSDEQFNTPVNYSLGSIRAQVTHLAGVEQGWFSDLRGVLPDAASDPKQCHDRAALRGLWDTIEQEIRAYLDTVTTEQLLAHPHTEGPDKALTLWQILIHVMNHATDHRAQALRMINDQGIDTTSQDLVFYLYARAEAAQARESAAADS